MKQGGFATILVLLAVVLVSGVGVGWYLSQQGIIPKFSTPVTTEQPPAPPPVPGEFTTDETANWKTYKSISANFSIRYPSTWKTLNMQTETYPDMVSFGPGITGLTEDSNIKVWIQVHKTNSQLKNAQEFIRSQLETEQSAPNFVDGKIEVILLDGKPGYKLALVKKLGNKVNKNLLIAVDYKNFVYVISGQDAEEFDQILSTFKFLD